MSTRILYCVQNWSRHLFYNY